MVPSKLESDGINLPGLSQLRLTVDKNCEFYFHVMYVSTLPTSTHVPHVHTWYKEEQKREVLDLLDLEF